jgi:hypothetical protein
MTNEHKTCAGFGTQTAAIVAGGPGSTFGAKTESWNGTNWTEIADIGTSRSYVSGCGTNTSGVIFGSASPPLTATEEFNAGPATVTFDVS